ncbi:MAG: preprotein translocase subunit SecY [Desulfobacterota bacterium]|nr:preprotein translocase subunit SecY [Thermodesulfobacteriota bacterium]MDW8002394.1 preprotein translocase subunit SecY [Deltaproteobacteria bacterium]
MNGFWNIGKIPELKRRILVTLALLSVYRIGVHIPTPGIDGRVLAEIFERAKGTILSFLDMFAGGGLERLSVFALGIMPYISASIILQLLTVVVPSLERLSKEGELGRRKITQYTRYGTVIISLIQGFGISIGLEQMRGIDGEPVVYNPGWGFRFMTMLTLTGGTSFLMWLGEQITEKGIGNGISLIIFAGIVARMPNAIAKTLTLVSAGEINWFVVALLIVMMLLVVGFIIFMETAQRRIPVQYAKRIVGRRIYGGQTTHLPLKINTSGVIPPIFASSLIMFPATVANFVPHPYMKQFAEYLTPGTLLHELLYVGFIIFFCFFYTAIVFNPDNVAENIQKYGGYIPGIRPGKKTSEYIERILTRITFLGALYVSFVCVLPTILVKEFNVPFYFGGTALLIVVGVALDTIQQIEAHLILRHYDGLVRKTARMRGRR